MSDEIIINRYRESLSQLELKALREYNRTGKVTESVIEIISKLGKWEVATITGLLKDSYKDTYDESIVMLGSYNLRNDKAMELAVNTPIKGELFSSRIWRNKVKLANRVHSDIIKNIEDGTDIRKLSEVLAKDFNTGTYQALRLLHNETQRVVNEAQLDSYKDSDVVKEVEFLAAIDDRTTDICIGLNGTRYDKHDPHIPRIPEDTHIGCRSTYIPIVK